MSTTADDTPVPSASRLAGKVAIVTGAGSAAGLLGTGAAIARLLAAHGAAVVAVDVSAERAATTVGAVEAAGGVAEALLGDVTSPADCAAAVAHAEARWGALHIVVNNAGVVPRQGTAHEGFDDAEWQRVLDVNLKGPTVLSEAAAPALARAGGGSIVNISSIAAFRGMGAGAYASSKAGLIGLTIDHAYRFGRDGIRVNCIAPGHLYTPMGEGTPTSRELRRRAGLLGTEGTAWDVAWACVFLAADESRWISGVVLPVDAGTTSTTAMPMHRLMVD